MKTPAIARHVTTKRKARGIERTVLFVYLVSAIACAAGCKSGCKKDAGELTTPGAAIPTPMTRAGYVTDNGSDAISVFDRDGTTVTNVPLDLDPSAHEAPHHLAIDRAAGALFVALAFPPPPLPTNDPHASHGRGDTKGKLARLDLTKLAVNAARDVDENPGDVVTTHDGAHVLVTHYDMKRAMDVASAGGSTSKMFAALQLWDARTMTLFGARPICVAPHGITVTLDDKTAIVACYGSDEIAIVDLTSPELPTARFPLGASPGAPGAPTYGPYSATLSPDGTRVVVADLESMDVRVFDRDRKAFLPEKTVSLGARAFMPAFVDARSILVPLQSPDGIARIDVDSGAIVKQVATGAACKSPHVARIAKDRRAYVVCEGDHVGPGVVVEVDPASLAVVRSWTVGVYPDGLVFGDDD